MGGKIQMEGSLQKSSNIEEQEDKAKQNESHISVENIFVGTFDNYLGHIIFTSMLLDFISHG